MNVPIKILRNRYWSSRVSLAILPVVFLPVPIFGRSTVNIGRAELASEVETQKKGGEILELSGARNVGEIGGYKTEDGKTLKTHAFLRSDRTRRLAEEDIKKLKDYGVKTVVDLRYAGEISEAKDKLSETEGITYRNVPAVIPKEVTVKPVKSERTRAEAYLRMFEGKETVKKLFETIASAE